MPTEKDSSELTSMPPEPFEERLKKMSPAERDADALRLWQKAQLVLAADREREEIEATAIDVTPEA